MNFEFAPYLLLRSPVKTPADYQKGLDHFLRDRFFRTALKLATAKSGYHICQCFFVRYEDPAPHLRLRLQVDLADISPILQAFKTRLQGRVRQQVIQEFQIGVYARELERYASAGIALIERFFSASSALVLLYIQKSARAAAPQRYHFALYTIRWLIEAFQQSVAPKALQ